MTSPQLPHQKTVSAGVYAPSALQHLGDILDSPGDAAREIVENGLDAGKEHELLGVNHTIRIGIYISHRRIIITDNGHGMTPFVKQEDQDSLQMYMTDVTQRRSMSFHDDVRDYITRGSMRSLEWMVSFAALSSKRPKPGERIRGKRGIGLLSTRMMGGKITVTTRPSPQLAVEYWGQNILNEGIPVFQLQPPTTDQLAHGDVQSTIIRLDEPLRDIDNKVLEHGTRIEITDLFLDDGGTLPSTLRPTALTELFSKRFGVDLREGHEIVIEDNYSDRGRNQRIVVPPPSYRGILVYEGEETMRGASGGTVRALIWHDPRGRALRPSVVRAGSAVGVITSVIPDLRTKAPWNSGTLSGEVFAPDLDETALPWDTAKKMLRGKTPAYNQLVKVLENIGEIIAAKIEDIEQQSRQDRQAELASDMSAAIRGALEDLEGFQDIKTGILGVTPPPISSIGPTPSDTRTRVKVFDEHEQGVKGVKVQLLQNSQLIREGATGKNGFWSFGELTRGKWAISIIVPVGAQLEKHSAATRRFDISDHRPGQLIQFKLILGTPEPPEKAPTPPKKNIPKFTIDYRPFGTEDDRYDATRIDTGLILLNTDYPPFQRALTVSDGEELAAQSAEYAAMAIVNRFMADQRELENHDALVSRLSAGIRAHGKQIRLQRQTAP